MMKDSPSLDVRPAAATAHWSRGMVANGVPLSDRQDATSSITEWNDWCPVWEARGNVQTALGEASDGPGLGEVEQSPPILPEFGKPVGAMIDWLETRQDVAHRVQRPTYIAGGKPDRAMPSDHVERLAAPVSGPATLKMVEDGTHAANSHLSSDRSAIRRSIDQSAGNLSPVHREETNIWRLE